MRLRKTVRFVPVGTAKSDPLASSPALTAELHRQHLVRKGTVPVVVPVTAPADVSAAVRIAKAHRYDGVDKLTEDERIAIAEANAAEARRRRGARS